MRFFPPTDAPVSIGLTTGHMAFVTSEGTELDKMFHREAIALGCTPAGIEKPQPADTKQDFDRRQVIVDAMNAMLNGNDESDFKKDGTPDLRAVSRRAGFQVSREEVEAIWSELSEVQE
jgi:hypothetical protein